MSQASVGYVQWFLLVSEAVHWRVSPRFLFRIPLLEFRVSHRRGRGLGFNIGASLITIGCRSVVLYKQIHRTYTSGGDDYCLFVSDLGDSWGLRGQGLRVQGLAQSGAVGFQGSRESSTLRPKNPVSYIHSALRVDRISTHRKSQTPSPISQNFTKQETDKPKHQK